MKITFAAYGCGQGQKPPKRASGVFLKARHFATASKPDTSQLPLTKKKSAARCSVLPLSRLSVESGRCADLPILEKQVRVEAFDILTSDGADVRSGPPKIVIDLKQIFS